MNSAALNSIVGSWEFVRSTDPDFDCRTIYHFSSDGFNYWETDQPDKSGRHLTRLKYKFDKGVLTLIYAAGSERQFTLTPESDGSIKFPGVRNHIWWMRKLEKPLSHSAAFIDSTGSFYRLNDTEQDAAANP